MPFGAKVADFGWARKPGALKASYTAPEGDLPRVSTRWLAIESMEKRIFSEKSDVWSAGVTMWECYSYAETPYSEVSTPLRIAI